MFCEKCGTALIDGVCPKCVENENNAVSKSEERFKDFFMSPNEKMVAVLGNSYLANFLQDRSVEKGFIVVSNKRVYFEGKKYNFGENGEIEEVYNSRVVDLRDVTGTGFDAYVNRHWLYGAIILIVLLVICPIFIKIYSFFKVSKVMMGENVSFATFNANFNIIKMVISSLISNAILVLPALYCFYRYQKSELSLIVVQYAGGEMGYELSWFSNQEIDLFQKDLRLAKDKTLEKENMSVFNEAPKQNSVADELTKLADLFAKGVITQEEFEKMKKDLI